MPAEICMVWASSFFPVCSQKTAPQVTKLASLLFIPGAQGCLHSSRVLFRPRPSFHSSLCLSSARGPCSCCDVMFFPRYILLEACFFPCAHWLAHLRGRGGQPLPTAPQQLLGPEGFPMLQEQVASCPSRRSSVTVLPD